MRNFKEKSKSLRREYVAKLEGPFMDYLGRVFAEVFKNFGTSGITADSAMSGDSPVKNWGGVGTKDFKLPERAKGVPPLKEGPVANVTVPVDDLVKDYYQAMDWDPETGKPSKKELEELGLGDVAEDLWSERVVS